MLILARSSELLDSFEDSEERNCSLKFFQTYLSPSATRRKTVAELILVAKTVIIVAVEMAATILLTFPWLAWALLVSAVVLAVLELHFLLFASPEDVRRREEEERYVEEIRHREMSESLRRSAAKRLLS